MQEWIQSHQATKGRRRTARIEPVHAKSRRLFLQCFTGAIGDRFYFDAKSTGLIHARTHFLGSVTARIPYLEIEVGRSSDFQSRKIARSQASEGSASRYEGDRAPSCFRISGKLAAYLCHVCPRLQRIAGSKPHATKLAINNRTVNIRR